MVYEMALTKTTRSRKIGKKIVLVLEPLALMQVVFITKPDFGECVYFQGYEI